MRAPSTGREMPDEERIPADLTTLIWPALVLGALILAASESVVTRVLAVFCGRDDPGCDLDVMHLAFKTVLLVWGLVLLYRTRVNIRRASAVRNEGRHPPRGVRLPFPVWVRRDPRALREGVMIYRTFAFCDAAVGFLLLVLWWRLSG